MNIGDVVRLKGGMNSAIITVTAIKGREKDIHGFDYFGEIDNSCSYYLFDQEDVELIIYTANSSQAEKTII